MAANPGPQGGPPQAEEILSEPQRRLLETKHKLTAWWQTRYWAGFPDGCDMDIDNIPGWEKIAFPDPRPFPDAFDGIPDPEPNLMDIDFEDLQDMFQEEDEQYTREAALTWNATKAIWRNERKLRAAGMRFVNVLAAGGQGLACTYECTSRDGETALVVVKMPIYADDSLGRERRNHMSTRGCEHVVQQLSMQANQVPEAGQENDQVAIDEDSRLLIIERLPTGTLEKAIVTAGWRMGQNFPNRTLWSIFHSLVQAVCGLEWPTVNSDQFLVENPNNPFRILTKPEAIFKQGALPWANYDERPLVHLDIDPKNVFVGPLEFPKGNEAAPCVKIGDLGLARGFRDIDWLDEREMWELRRYGKVSIYTPEQNSREWDFLRDSIPRKRESTAGNYGGHTNVYQIGLLMYSLITKHHMPVPPIISAVGPNLSLPVWDPTSNQVVDLDINRGGLLPTYGGALLRGTRYAATAFGLRVLVAWCLARRPCDRPPLQFLKSITANYDVNPELETAVPNPAETDQMVRDWCARIFHEPEPASETYPPMPFDLDPDPDRPLLRGSLPARPNPFGAKPDGPANTAVPRLAGESGPWQLPLPVPPPANQAQNDPAQGDPQRRRDILRRAVRKVLPKRGLRKAKLVHRFGRFLENMADKAVDKFGIKNRGVLDRNASRGSRVSGNGNGSLGPRNSRDPGGPGGGSTGLSSAMGNLGLGLFG